VFREAGNAGFSCYNVTESRATAQPCLPLFIKEPLKEGLRFLAFGFYFGLWLGFLLWAFWCGKLLEGKGITEGKRMAKDRLIKSLYREL
jgi:uncharacterized RDD family membrane protein YckC